ncbi:uncharacterized protein [Physcomitrium patens]|uniref:Uncharacterized protein n=1 Tax=Physcomitrium patens TaxID=3218 RepID=A0A2K1K7D7_PHYPA|nr:uncharacterized protein LOC112285482 isoform X1 [Physcomitrium patens]XP_024382119.1 uncharacterized protein LOC112285482 isoform X1 [Physcomitrium patens]XP_024382120.1 uncharacterized protein LOC112285482 isoform X1 [Physcomitrium patens]PNR49694.1 hypothetical protein PHYPA_011590 [Physcomitrium patens]|eukprot:XP_024382118.1 uncharacterized protein LOC112285482 isoform X1 [Physcomitrella patens]
MWIFPSISCWNVVVVVFLGFVYEATFEGWIVEVSGMRSDLRIEACGLIFQETESGWMGGGGSTRTRRVGAIYAPFSDTSWLASFLHSFFGLVIRSGRAIEYL